MRRFFSVSARASSVCWRIFLLHEDQDAIAGLHADDVGTSAQVLRLPGYRVGAFKNINVSTISACFFIVLGDQPQIPATVYRKLLEAEPAEVIQPTYMEKHGHPILLSAKVRRAILDADENDPTVNLRIILEPGHKRIVEVDEPNILVDLDTPEDYNRGER